MVRRLKAQTTTAIGATANHARANLTFKQAAVLEAFVASGTFMPSCFENALVFLQKQTPPGPRDRLLIGPSSQGSRVRVASSLDFDQKPF
jgi:hypothetical protein